MFSLTYVAEGAFGIVNLCLDDGPSLTLGRISAHYIGNFGKYHIKLEEAYVL